ncbi:CLUMA_CG019018, isoform A [Clunio marinus]|uniref:CLUMA_CG019018, isoform A n=1 Tax=Clunio marinus TaxID=568069 RepID=A0A1J1J3C9_9DIPT|nr:CLUMA_CG019018, isoform A [Clunio marinus]
MRLNYILSEFKKNWLIASIGIALYVFGFIILNINEGRAFNHSRALEEALQKAVSFKEADYQRQNGKSENYEGKLIHVSGYVRVQEPIADATYNILVQAVKLRKIVQMYQWHEDYTENKFAEGDETARNYFYYKDWSENVVDSRSFHSLGHQNPRQLPMQSRMMIADKTYIGNFEIGESAKELFTGWIDVTSDTRPEDPYIKMHLGWYFHVDDLYDPLVGDTRVKFQFAGLQGSVYTIVGKLVNGKIEPYKSNLKKKIILLSKGELTIEEIFKEEHYAVRKKTWIIRLFGFVLIFFGVISTSSLLRVFNRSRLSFLSPNPSCQLRSNIQIAGIFTITICILRQSLHYLGIMT